MIRVNLFHCWFFGINVFNFNIIINTKVRMLKLCVGIIFVKDVICLALHGLFYILEKYKRIEKKTVIRFLSDQNLHLHLVTYFYSNFEVNIKIIL